jgi:plastocyanin
MRNGIDAPDACEPAHSAIAAVAAATARRKLAGGNEVKTKERLCMLHLFRSATFAAFLAALSVACASCQQQSPQNGVTTVSILGDSGKHSYSPGMLSVPIGTTVTWVNQDSKPHTVTDPGVFDSGPIPPDGGRWSWGASAAGSYTYHCLIDPDMNGTIVVTVPQPTPY